MRGFFIAMLLSTALISNAQDPTDMRIQNQRILDQFFAYQKSNAPLGEMDVPPGTEGTPYLEDDFIVGKVHLVDGKWFDEIPLRFNVFNDAIEYKFKDLVAEITNLEEIDRFEFDGKTYVHQAYLVRKNFDESIMQRVNSGKYQHLIKHTIKFKDAEEPAAYQEAKPPRFVHQGDKYYLSVNGQPAVQYNSKGELFKLLGTSSELAKNYFKENKIRISKSPEMQKFFDWFNALEEDK